MMFAESHRRHILTIIAYIDHLLGDAYIQIQGDTGRSLFPRYVVDATPVQYQILGDYLARFRHIAGGFLAVHGIVNEQAPISALWAFRTALSYAATSLDELAANALTGYGPLEPDLIAEMEGLRNQLHSLFREMDEYLVGDRGGDLATRLARLDRTRNEVALLQELEGIVSRHGLVEFHSTLKWLTARFERECLEIAFVGRVSSGKSSLINALLGKNLLPVGVTPITSVPIRIVHGKQESVLVSIAQEQPLLILPQQLAEYASEEGNPGNIKRVSAIEVSLPDTLLANDLCFVDTPGLGSLATTGATQTIAYLPRCDVAIFLVDCQGTLTAEDVWVVHQLLEGGAEIVVVLSKADLLPEAERTKFSTYVRSQLAAALGTELEVSAVSALAESGIRVKDWFAEEVGQLIAQRRSIVLASRRRKVGALREDVIAALKVRRGAGMPTDLPSMVRSPLMLTEAHRLLADARRRLRDWARLQPAQVAELQTVAVRALAKAWADHSTAGEAIVLAVANEIATWGRTCEGILREVQSRLNSLLPSGNSLPPPAGCPLFDPTPLAVAAQWTPRWRAAFGHWGRLLDAHSQFSAVLAERFPMLLQRYREALMNWGLQVLGADEEAINTIMAGSATLARLATDQEVGAPELRSADLARLQNWESLVAPEEEWRDALANTINHGSSEPQGQPQRH